MQESLLINKIPGDKLWSIPYEAASQHGLTEGQMVEIKHGSLSAQAKVITSCDKSIGLTNDILNHLRLLTNSKIGIKSEGSNKFRLGPLIGILTFSHVIAKKDLNRYIPYAVKMKNIGFLYVFGPKSIDSTLRTIKGFYYNFRQNAWQETEFPFPDVVMDRIYPNNRKSHSELEKIIGQNRIFNKKTLINKINFSRTLHKDNFLQNHVPETRLFGSISDFEYMLRKHPGLFMKPVNGMKGKGIIQLKKQDNNLVCRYMGEQGPKTHIIKQSCDIFDVLKCVGKGKKTYIIQAEILRMEYNKQAFGLRAMAVKNGSGQWSVPAIFAKTSDPTGFLTNTSAGAKIIFLRDLLNGIQDKLPYSNKHFLSLLTEISIKAAYALDEKFGPLGKLGIDIVVDNFGKPWLIEANGNPGLMPRAALGEYPDWRSQMYDFPLAYCLYLSGFSHLKNTLPF